MTCWQDIAITVLCFGLGVIALPSVFSKTKPKRSLCLNMALIITVLGIVFATMQLWLSLGAELFAAAPWWIMLFQKRKR